MKLSQNKPFAALLVLLAVFGQTVFAESASNSDSLIVAEINQDSITQAELKTEIQLHFKQHLNDLEESQIRLLQKRVLKRMIERKMLVQAAKESGLYPEKHGVEAKFQNLLKQDESPDSFASYMQAQGISRDVFLKGLRDDLAVRAYIEQKVFNAVSVSEDSAREVFESDPAPFTPPEEVRARHILIKTHPQMSTEQVAERLEKANDVLARAKRSGADFAAIAKDYSHGPGRSKGGDLGYFTKNQHDPIFTKAAFALQIGEISNIVQTKHGFHIIKVVDRRGGVRPDYEEVKQRVYNELLEQQKLEALELHLSKLTEKSKVIIYMH
jgi:peptidyl-prolyl cis-trans isomerase C